MRILLGSLGTLTIHPWGGFHGLAFVELRIFGRQGAIGFQMLDGHEFLDVAQEGVDGLEQIKNHFSFVVGWSSGQSGYFIPVVWAQLEGSTTVS